MNRRLIMATVCAGLLSAPVAVAVAWADSSAAEYPTAAQLAGLSTGEIQTLNSGAPVNVVMDPSTGDILSVATPSAAVSVLDNRAVAH